MLCIDRQRDVDAIYESPICCDMKCLYVNDLPILISCNPLNVFSMLKTYLFLYPIHLMSCLKLMTYLFLYPIPLMSYVNDLSILISYPFNILSMLMTNLSCNPLNILSLLKTYLFLYHIPLMSYLFYILYMKIWAHNNKRV